MAGCLTRARAIKLSLHEFVDKKTKPINATFSFWTSMLHVGRYLVRLKTAHLIKPSHPTWLAPSGLALTKMKKCQFLYKGKSREHQSPIY